MRLALNDRVTVLNAATAPDPYNNPTPNWASAVETVEPAQVRPVTSDEVVVNEDTVEARWRLTLGSATAATSASRVVWRDLTFEIEGEVLPYPDSRGRINHYAAYLKRVTG